MGSGGRTRRWTVRPPPRCRRPGRVRRARPRACPTARSRACAAPPRRSRRRAWPTSAVRSARRCPSTLCSETSEPYSGGRREGHAMAWDFETDPEYQEKLDWVDAFVREECEPLDFAFPHLQFTPLDDARRRIVDPLKEEVR